MAFNQKGIAPLIIVAGVVLGLAVIGGGTIISNQLAASIPQDTPQQSRSISVEDLGLGIFSSGQSAQQINKPTPESSPQPAAVTQNASPSPKSQSAFDRLLQRFNLQPKPTPTPASSVVVINTPSPTTSNTNSTVTTVNMPSPQSSPTPTTSTVSSSATPAYAPPTTTSTAATPPTPNPTQTASPTPQASSAYTGIATCEVHFEPKTGTAPVNIKLIYGMKATGYVGFNAYVKEVQWDWNGDGTWDTDYSVNNQQYSHTYDTPGTYHPKMHLKLNGGYETQICTNSITIN